MREKSDPTAPIYYVLLLFFVAAFWITVGIVIRAAIR